MAKAVFILVGSETTEHFDNSNPRWESYGSTSRLCFERIKVCHSEVVHFFGGGWVGGCSLECSHESAVQYRPVLRCAEDLVNNGRSGKVKADSCRMDMRESRTCRMFESQSAVHCSPSMMNILIRMWNGKPPDGPRASMKFQTRAERKQNKKKTVM